MKKCWWILVCLLFCGCAFQRASFVAAEGTVKGAVVQPVQALEMAQSHLEQHGTVVWKNPDDLKTFLVLRGKYYYVKRSDFPAKTPNWYLHSAIRIHRRTGVLSYVGP